jgi:myo-inositol-1(or 4)-monophosphatase
MVHKLTKKEKLSLMSKASTISVSAGKTLIKKFGLDAGIKSSKKKDIKTLADMAANDLIVSGLRKISDFKIVSEENKKSYRYLHSNTGQPAWVIDPLDGTMNFTRSFPVYCISIALWYGNRAVLGVIYDISKNTIYSGICEGPAWKNNEIIRVSNISKIKKAIMATGFPSGCDYETASLLKFIKNIQDFKKIRMIGSAALSLAQVAAGVFEIYYEKDINVWDVAAGFAIVEASGGNIYRSEINKYGRLDAIAWNGKFDIKGIL